MMGMSGQGKRLSCFDIFVNALYLETTLKPGNLGGARRALVATVVARVDGVEVLWDKQKLLSVRQGQTFFLANHLC